MSHDRVSMVTIRNRSGFTLIELMIVIMIIGILLNISLPNYISVKKKAHAARIVSDYKIVRDAAILYHADTGRWPSTSRAGRPPKQLIEYLPKDFSWDLGPELSVRYRWLNFARRRRLRRRLGGSVGLIVYSKDRSLLKAIQGVYDGPMWPRRISRRSRAVILLVENS